MLSIVIWDVQHGSAAYIKTPNGKHIVIDLGVGDTSEGSETFSPLSCLRAREVKQLDEVIITHPHRDHLDDIFEFDNLNPRVLRRPKHLSEQEIREGNRPGDSRILDKYLEISNRFSQPVPQQNDPENADNNGGVVITTFTPTDCSKSQLNNHSIITFLSYASTTICIPGDNESPAWCELISKQAFRNLLKSTSILIAPHHGREAGYCSDVFEHCSPRLVIVSDGPGSDTSAVSKYYEHSKGWPVRSRSTGKTETRYVLTTRNDGTVEIQAHSNSAGQNSLGISIE